MKERRTNALDRTLRQMVIKSKRVSVSADTREIFIDGKVVDEIPPYTEKSKCQSLINKWVKYANFQERNHAELVLPKLF